MLDTMRRYTNRLASAPPPPRWRTANPAPPLGAPPPGAAADLAAYVAHVAQEAADGRLDGVGVAVLDEGRAALDAAAAAPALPAPAPPRRGG